jgi:hypothetical protein
MVYVQTIRCCIKQYSVHGFPGAVAFLNVWSVCNGSWGDSLWSAGARAPGQKSSYRNVVAA